MVLAIIGLSLAVSTWALKPIRDRAIVGRAMASFKDVSGLARQSAIETGEAVSLTIDTENRVISANGLGRSQRLPAEVDLSWTSGVDRHGDAGRTPGHASIVFLPDGTSSGGRFLVRLGAIQQSVRISWVSGATVDEP